jgi:hypothetical protein
MPVLSSRKPNSTSSRTSFHRVVVGWSNLEAEREQPTSGLPPEDQAVWNRIVSLRRPSGSAKEYAWRWLRTWSWLMREKPGLHLPRPWIFSNEEGEIEFEWELEGRCLILTLAEDAFRFSRTDGLEEGGIEEAGSVDIAGVKPLLDWVVGG